MKQRPTRHLSHDWTSVRSYNAANLPRDIKIPPSTKVLNGISPRSEMREAVAVAKLAHGVSLKIRRPRPLSPLIAEVFGEVLGSRRRRSRAEEDRLLSTRKFGLCSCDICIAFCCQGNGRDTCNSDEGTRVIATRQSRVSLFSRPFFPLPGGHTGFFKAEPT